MSQRFHGLHLALERGLLNLQAHGAKAACNGRLQLNCLGIQQVINWASHFSHLAPLNEAPECCSLISCELDILTSGQWLCRLHIQPQELGQEEEAMHDPC
jgi:hypothetical protein